MNETRVGQIDLGPDPDSNPEWIAEVRRRLKEWYEHHRRDLPWRVQLDPYRVLVAEVMLVQTTVAAVIPFYERFLKRFPTIADLAGAPEEDVLKAWEGLGYYRRARQLQSAAQAVMTLHGGEFPRDPEAILGLPGVGRYIQGAVLSFAFNRAAPILEANTQRVAARWLAIEDDLKASATQARLWRAAERLVPDDDPGTFNQAFMEIGALICRPAAPACLVCPVSTLCRARALGIQERIPKTTPKPPPLDVRETVIVASRADGRYALGQRGQGGLWSGFWEFPTLHRAGANPAQRLEVEDDEDLADGLRTLTGIEAEIGPQAHSLSYGVTKHKVAVSVRRAVWRSGEPRVNSAEWVRADWRSLDEMATLTLSSASRKIVSWLAKTL